MTTAAADPNVIDQFAREIASGKTPEQAMLSLRQQGAPLGTAQAIAAEWQRLASELRAAPWPPALIGPDTIPAPWYVETGMRSKRWRGVAARLSVTLNRDAVESVDAASAKIVSLLSAPGVSSFASRGLVLGNVQSGKTTSFIAVAAKAADAGYRVIIVLSGTTDILRQQTQERIEQVLTGDEPSWQLLTTAEDDFTSDPRHATGTLLAKGRVVVAVIKKQPDRLGALCDWLDGAGAVIVKKMPMLVIDDEADNASLDVGNGDEQSTINALLRRLLDHPRAAYLAYTATPFANVLTDTSDLEGLYPRDFLVDIPAPAAYFGAERVFGRDRLDGENDTTHDGLDVIRNVSDAEAAFVRAVDADHGAPSSHVPALLRAIRWFVLATAARRVRSGTAAHSTMLVHTSMETIRHTAIAAVVENLLGGIRASLLTGDDAELSEMRLCWEREHSCVDAAQFGHNPVVFDDLVAHLGSVVQQITLVIDNNVSGSRLSYTKDSPTVAIVIGGNTLSRGLTLEGLCSSYFVRTSRTYDTLLQMGRWFGYRVGYEDLWRAWMPDLLTDWFRDLALVEAEIRQEIRDASVEGVSPERVGVRIRLHPSMAVTSGLKARFAVSSLTSYSRKRPQTILFKRKDVAWLRTNIEAVRELAAGAASDDVELRTFAGGRRGFRGVSTLRILQFLSRYQTHERTQSMRRDALEAYIRNELEMGSLTEWSVVFMTPPASPGTALKRKTIDLGVGTEFTLAKRSRVWSSDSNTANLKSITSETDRIADLEIGPVEALSLLGESAPESTDSAFIRVREHLQLTNGVLGIYPIDAASVPDLSRAKGRGERRVPLEAVEHLVGVALFFPQGSESEAGITYIEAPTGADPGASTKG